MFIPIKTKDESPDANTAHTKETEVLVIAAIVTHLFVPSGKFGLPYVYLPSCLQRKAFADGYKNNAVLVCNPVLLYEV